MTSVYKTLQYSFYIYACLRNILKRKESLVALFKLCHDNLRSMALPRGAMGWSAFHDCDISGSYTITL